MDDDIFQTLRNSTPMFLETLPTTTTPISSTASEAIHLTTSKADEFFENVSDDFDFFQEIKTQTYDTIITTTVATTTTTSSLTSMFMSTMVSKHVLDSEEDSSEEEFENYYKALKAKQATATESFTTSTTAIPQVLVTETPSYENRNELELLKQRVSNLTDTVRLFMTVITSQFTKETPNETRSDVITPMTNDTVDSDSKVKILNKTSSFFDLETNYANKTLFATVFLTSETWVLPVFGVTCFIVLLCFCFCLYCCCKSTCCQCTKSKKTNRTIRVKKLQELKPETLDRFISIPDLVHTTNTQETVPLSEYKLRFNEPNYESVFHPTMSRPKPPPRFASLPAYRDVPWLNVTEQDLQTVTLTQTLPRNIKKRKPLPFTTSTLTITKRFMESSV